MIYILPTNTCFWMACPISNKQNYEKIYEIKQRDKSKAIAIMIEDFFYFSEQTKLNKKQIDFLKKYKNPFTILINKNKILDKKLLEIINDLDNSENYEKIAFRVAHNFMHRKLIKSHWLLFLTSANISDNKEIFDTIWIKESFWNILKKEEIQILAHWDFCINSGQKYSDIFEFKWESEEIIYFRK